MNEYETYRAKALESFFVSIGYAILAYAKKLNIKDPPKKPYTQNTQKTVWDKEPAKPKTEKTTEKRTEDFESMP